LKDLKLEFPKADEARLKELQAMKRQLAK
jgi:hypothetical protein